MKCPSITTDHTEYTEKENKSNFVWSVVKKNPVV